MTLARVEYINNAGYSGKDVRPLLMGGSTALRTDGLLEEVMGAGGRLELGREPVLALAFAAMLLAYARDRAEQGALASRGCLAVLARLLQVRGCIIEKCTNNLICW